MKILFSKAFCKMENKKSDKENITPVSEAALPPEFKKFDKPFGLEQHVFNLIFLGIITHLCAAYYFLYLWPFGIVPRWTLLYGTIYGYITGLGTTVGAHRYWTHKTFKANKPLQYLLMLMQTAAWQYPIFKWCRDHRVHHKYSDTDADPHNSSRGFWFSHITWLFQPKHPEVVEKLKIIDISDLARDPVVRFQSKYYWEILFFVFFLIPMGMFYYLFPEMSLFHNFVSNFTRYAVSLHFTFLVNSAAHMWGDKPYDKYITPTENKIVSLLAVGEGWHNYHHTFPWDHKSAEFGYKINLSTFFIHFFAMIGWAWDLKTVSHKLLVDRINRTGDGSHPLHRNNQMSRSGSEEVKQSVGDSALPSWGWGDKELKKEDVEITETLYVSNSRRG